MVCGSKKQYVGFEKFEIVKFKKTMRLEKLSDEARRNEIKDLKKFKY